MTVNDNKTCAPGLLHAIPECLPAMMHSIDAQGAIVWVSDRWLEVMGYERGQVLGRKSTDFLTEDSRRFATEMVLPDFFRSGFCVDVPYQMVTASGEILDVLLSATAEMDADGAVLRSLAVVNNITELKRAEQALRESEEKFRAMADTSYDAIVVIDARDTVVFWNDAAVRMFGYSVQEAMGSPFHELATLAGDRSKAYAGLEYFAATGRGPVVGSITELMALRKDGSVLPVERSVNAFQSQGQWYAVGILRDITQRKEAERQLTILATIDSLTGLNNRRNFRVLSKQALEHAKRYSEPLSLITFDVDRFKIVNDTHGHEAGDAVLTALAACCRECFRKVDILGRLGGEEFGVCLPQTDADAAVRVAERFREAVAARPMATTQGVDLHITVSLGVAELNVPMDSLDDLLKRADTALYLAKSGGRNRCVAG
jgi:diguanylate cyclase (GGDEF)-like protein/PAS domain S-box-containing protein